MTTAEYHVQLLSRTDLCEQCADGLNESPATHIGREQVSRVRFAEVRLCDDHAADFPVPQSYGADSNGVPRSSFIRPIPKGASK